MIEDLSDIFRVEMVGSPSQPELLLLTYIEQFLPSGDWTTPPLNILQHCVVLAVSAVLPSLLFPPPHLLLLLLLH